MFKGSSILLLVADDSGPQGGSILGAVDAQRSESCAFLGSFGNLAERLHLVFRHNGLLEGQI